MCRGDGATRVGRRQIIGRNNFLKKQDEEMRRDGSQFRIKHLLKKWCSREQSAINQPTEVNWSGREGGGSICHYNRRSGWWWKLRGDGRYIYLLCCLVLFLFIFLWNVGAPSWRWPGWPWNHQPKQVSPGCTEVLQSCKKDQNAAFPNHMLRF